MHERQFKDITHLLEEDAKSSFYEQKLHLRSVESNQIRQFRKYVRTIKEPTNDYFQVSGPLVLHQPTTLEFTTQYNEDNSEVVPNYSYDFVEPFYMSCINYEQFIPTFIEHDFLNNLLAELFTGNILSIYPNETPTRRDSPLDKLLINSVLGSIIADNENNPLFCIGSHIEPYGNQKIDLTLGHKANQYFH